MKLKLSVLDQVAIRRNSNAYEALAEAVELVRFAEGLGYTRYWMSEHHNFAMLAGASPEILIARLGGETKTIRLGSGGIMLPNHSALKVAENFRMLEALFPGRVDLGIGRAPGGDRATAAILNPTNTFDPKEYINQITMLKAFLNDYETPSPVHENIRAIPIIPSAPSLWMLTSSGESAYIAAHFGLAVSFAHFINPIGGPEAVKQYRKLFKPSEQLAAPQCNVGIFVFCGDTEESVMRAQTVMDYRLLSIEKGRGDESPSYDAVKNVKYSPEEWQRVLFNRQRMIVGTPDFVKEELTSLATRYDVDEIVVATFADSKEERFRSYELVMKVVGD